MVYFQGHAAPGIYARAFLEGRLDEAHLQNFRQELAEGGGLSSYPHPYLMPDFWQFPTVSMGLGPILSIYQARFNRYLRARGFISGEEPKVWAFRRRRRKRTSRKRSAPHARLAREPRQPDLGRQLQPAAARRPGARQRQDHPGTGSGVPRRGLERHQGHLGLGLGPAAGGGQEGAAAQADGRSGGRRLPEVFRRAGQLHAEAFLRQVSRAAASW